MNIESVVPEPSVNVKIYPFDDKNFYVHQTEYDYRIKIGLFAKEILELANGKRSIPLISEEFEKRHFEKIPNEKIYELLCRDLAKYGIIKSDQKIERTDSTRYLSIKMMLFNPAQVKRVSGLFLPLFNPVFFYTSLSIALAFSIIVIASHFSFDLFRTSVSPELLGYFIAINIISLFFHELGHATACRYFGADHGGIGFGFYILSPVLFADVSDAWKLKASQRIIIDLGGFYMQALINVIILILYLITSDPIWLSMGALFVLGMILNLNPFMRRDGYWALSDMLNIPNLKTNSDKRIVAMVSNLFSRVPFSRPTRLDFTLVIYGILNWCFIGFVITSILLHDPYGLIHFPVNVFNFVHTIIFSFTTITFSFLKSEIGKLLLPFVFYLMVYNLVLSNLLKKMYNSLKMKITK